MNEFETRKKQRKDELAGLPWRAELRKVQCKRTKEQFLTPSQYGSLYFTKIKESLPVPTRYILRGASGEPSGNKTLLRAYAFATQHTAQVLRYRLQATGYRPKKG